MKRIEELQKQGKIVAMVWDGMNDAPALAKANLGIAIGSVTDIAKETGGLILMKDRLYDIYVELKLGSNPREENSGTVSFPEIHKGSMQ